jgi:membrane protease YdiL (CAAX protease family)
MPVKRITFKHKNTNFSIMKRMFLSGESIPRQLLFSALIIIGCWFVFQVFSYATGLLIYRIPVNDLAHLMENLDEPRMVSFLKYIQVFTSIGMFIVSAWIISNAISPEWALFLTLDKRPAIVPMITATAMIVVIIPFSNLLTSLNNELSFPGDLSGVERFFRDKEDQMQEIVEYFLKGRDIWDLMLNLTIIAIIPAVGEELIFRGILQNRLSTWFRNHHLAILLSAFLFSALHIQLFSFLPRFVLGIIFGYIFAWSGSIWITIHAHFVNNALAVIYYHLYYNGRTDDQLELIGTEGYGLFYSFSGAVMAALLIFLIYRYYRKRAVC